MSRSPCLLSTFILAITISITLQSTPVVSTFKALVIPVTKHTSTSLFSLTFNTTGHTHTSNSFILDISTHLSWLKNCHPKSCFPPIPCESNPCSDSKKYNPSICHKGRTSSSNISIGSGDNCRCRGIATNPISNRCAASHLTTVNFSISTTDGHNPLADASVGPVYMGCGPKKLVESLPSDTAGLVSFSRAPLSIPSQLAKSVGMAEQFGICLPSSGDSATGVAFMGSGPFFMKDSDHPGLNLTDRLLYTPLIQKPEGTSFDYYIGLFEITILQRPLDFSIDTTQEFDSYAVKLSTVIPYTTIRTPLYKALLKQYDEETSATPRATGPFDLCLNTTNLGSTPVGLPVPPVVLQLINFEYWTMFGGNLFKQVSEDVACLAFVDGGENAEHLMVIGSFQIENNFLMFDMVNKRLGFTNFLGFFDTNCSNFNFTSGV